MTDKPTPNARDQERIEIFRSSKSRQETATRLDMPSDYIPKLRARLEKKYGIKLPRYKVKDGRTFHTGDNPLAEKPEIYYEGWTADDCIKRLIEVVNEYPDKAISRNFFRTHSTISESTWDRYFGTFEGFKEQAGIKLSRQQHTLEKNIAMHASMDHYRAMNDIKGDWGEAYLRPDRKRFQTIMVINDLHDKEVDRFWLRVMLDTARRVQPEIISINGDLFDLPEFGRFHVDPRDWDVVGRIKFVHENILQPLREVCPSAQIDLNEGNHEYRLLRHMCDATPAMKVLLSDLHNMTIPQLLGLDEFEINYNSISDLAAKTVRDIKNELAKNYKSYHGCFMTHHFKEGMAYGMPGCNAHNHKHIATPLYSEVFGSYEWHQIGCGHMRSAVYCNGNMWSMGLELAHIDVEKKFVLQEYVPVGETLAVVGGKYYTRGEEE